ncbi:hypothetical protein Tco_1251973, partial [Tanacetum coccineum]
MPQEDEVFSAEEQPLPAAASPTAQSPDYVPKSDPEADLEEDDDEDLEEDPVDYLAYRGDGGDDEDESSEDDDEVNIEVDDDDEEEDHPAPADSAIVALPTADQAPSAEETEPFEIDESAITPPPHPAYRVTARISILAPVPTPVWFDAEIPSPPLPPIPSPSLPVSPPLQVSLPVLVLSTSPPASPICPLGYRAAMIRLRAEADRPKVTLPPRKRLDIALGPRYKIGESSSAAAAARPTGGLRADYGFVATMDREIRRDLERDVGYGITDSWDEIVEAMQGTPVVTDVTKLSQRMPEFETRVRRDIDEVYTRDAGGISQEAEAAHRGTEDDKETLNLDDRVRETAGTRQRSCIARATRGGCIIFSCDLKKMAPKRRTTRLNPETTPAATATTTTTVTNAQLQAMIDQGVTAALEARDANTNGADNHNSGTGARRNKRATRECTYPDFMKCQPLNFKGIEGVVELTQWINKMETVFHISNCSVENQIKFYTCTLLGNALTWWNSHVRTVGNDIAYAMT